MYSCLLFDKAQFPGLQNIRMWLASQGGERKAALGDLAERGKYTTANARSRKAWFVCRFADIKAGKVPVLADLKGPTELEQGVKAYA